MLTKSFGAVDVFCDYGNRVIQAQKVKISSNKNENKHISIAMFFYSFIYLHFGIYSGTLMGALNAMLSNNNDGNIWFTLR